MLALGAFDLLKGLDFEETAITWAVALVLLAGGRARSRSATTRSRCARRSGACRCSGSAASRSRRSPTGPRRAARRGARSCARPATCCAGRPGPIHFDHHHLRLDPAAVHLIEIGTLVAIAYVIFRPLAAPRALPGPARAAPPAELVRAHGTRHAVVLQAPRRQALLLHRRPPGVRRLPDRERRAAAVRRPGRPGRRAAGAARRAARLRRGARAEARRGRRERAAAARCTSARAADALPRRRGDGRLERVLARGPADPQGPPVGDAA